MSDEKIPDDVREFILRHINSVAQLEALLLLWSNPEKDWDGGAMARRLYTDDREASEVLAQLTADGLLSEHQGTYRFSGDWHAIVRKMAEVYAKQLIPITNMIHAKPRRIRAFADAFKFRKDH
jgi:hypothetical protein